jgi:hypothetical protein
MKRFVLLLFAAFITFNAAAQLRPISDGKRLLYPQLSPPDVAPDQVSGTPALQPGQKMMNVTVIGDTWYDTQTYNSGNLMNRIYQYPDGTIGATWMFKAATPPPDRGTAYNYFDNVAWHGMSNHLGGDANNAFPSYAPWGPNGEVVVHYQYVAGDGPLKILRRETKGTGVWQESVLNPPDGNYSLVWHSMITSGPNHEYLHILAYLYDDPYMGQDDALLYYRSPDGGVTWDINGVIIDGLGSAYFPTMSSLKYSWAQPIGNTIAFTYGFDQFDGLVFKSEDNGTTWQKFVVYQAPYSPFGLPDQTNYFGCGDGTSAIVLDSQGKAHVAFGRMVRVYDVVTSPPGGWYFVPGTEGMIYWDESMPPLDSTTVSTYTLDFLQEGGYLAGKVFPDTSFDIPDGQPNYGVGLTSGPQWALGASDQLYLVWSALSPRHFSGDYYYRHIFINATVDGGKSWTGIKDLTSDFYFSYSECVFPALAPLVNQKVNVVLQEDFTPGTGSGEEAFMDFIEFPKEYFVGTPETKEMSSFRVSECRPNPAGNTTTLLVRLERPADLRVTLSSAIGQSVRNFDLGETSGEVPVTLDLTGVQKGIYFLTVNAGGEKITRKVIVE